MLPRSHDDSDFLKPSNNSILMARAVDNEMRKKVQKNPRLIYQVTPKISANFWAIFDGQK